MNALAFVVQSDSGDSYFVVSHPAQLPLFLGAIVALLVILWILVALRRRSRPLEVFSNDSGRIKVSRGALTDLVESAALQYGAVSRPRVDFKKRGDQVHLYIRLKLAAGQRLPEFSSGLQSHLTATLRDALGLEKLGGVHLTITGFKGSALPPDMATPKSLSRIPPASPATPPKAPGGDFFST